MSVISAEQLAQANVTDLASLSSQRSRAQHVRLRGALRGAAAPIIRGINATAEPTRGFRTFEQNPVGTYIGNSPDRRLFPAGRSQAGRGAARTSGHLVRRRRPGRRVAAHSQRPGCSMRSPGSFEAGGDRLDHSSGTGYTVKGMVNIPLARHPGVPSLRKVRL